MVDLTYPSILLSFVHSSSLATLVTPHVASLIVAPPSYPIPSSSKYLLKRHLKGLTAADEVNNDSSSNDDAQYQQNLFTFGGRAYMTNVTLGNQKFTFIIDTGSASTWVAATTVECLRLPQKACKFGPLYDVRASKTYSKIPGVQFHIQYGDGEFQVGETGMEELVIGTHNALRVTQMIGVAEYGWWRGDGQSSGLLGLGYASMGNPTEFNYNPIMSTIFDEHDIPSIFSLALTRPTKVNPVGGGLFGIGGIPDIGHDDAFVSVPLLPEPMGEFFFYAILIDGFHITAPTNISSPAVPTAGKPLPKETSNLTAIIDSGTTLIYLPDSVAEQVASLFVPPAKYSIRDDSYYVQCKALAPRFGIIIAGKIFYVHQEDMMVSSVENALGQCLLGINKKGMGDVVLGDSFLKNVLAVFDIGNNEMRFAAREQY